VLPENSTVMIVTICVNIYHFRTMLAEHLPCTGRTVEQS
jgi:hypothetical protein